LLCACDVEETTPASQGVDLSADADADSGVARGADRGSLDAAVGGNSADAGLSGNAGDGGHGASKSPVDPRPIRGYVVVNSDFESSTVSVLDPEGEVLSPTLLSSGSAPAGLSRALGSDIVLPTSVMDGDEIVIIDRENTVLHWVDLQSAEVTAQLNVGPGGFMANPYDYVPYAKHKAFVTRYATNGDPGQADFDRGGDLLTIDPAAGEITGRIDLSFVLDDDSVEPRADSTVMSRGLIYVLLAAIDADFAEYGTPTLAVIDPEAEAVIDSLPITGLRNCGELRLSPDELTAVVGCAGDWGAEALDSSGLAFVSLAGESPELTSVLTANGLFGLQIAAVEFASNRLLAFTVNGAYDEEFNPASGDQLRWMDLDDDTFGGPLLETALPFNLGELRCAHVEETCLLADAETDGGLVWMIDVRERTLELGDGVAIDDGLGLPPRYVGKF
jgi:hypothetical protein